MHGFKARREQHPSGASQSHDNPGKLSLNLQRQQHDIDQETSSASMELEDIIGNFDSSSRKSISNSFASFLNLRSFSPTYFSANAADTAKDDETTSFYSALQDGFSLSQYDLKKPSRHSVSGGELFWNIDSTEKEVMLPISNFEVFWSDLTYKIEPSLTFSSAWNNLGRLFKSSVTALPVLLGCSKSYDFDHDETRPQAPITIIQSISGSFKSGELTGVMGPSGAGKTSLLNFLARRREEGYAGQLYVDNSKRKIKISTIPQHDHLPEYLSVRENLMFASRLKNPHPDYEHERNVERASTLLGLERCLDTKTKKISGGQSKRLAIAQELLSKPDILILDEPTSGLDSLTCYKTLTVLKNLVNSSAKKIIEPIAIVLTIHQPQEEVFDIFDKIYVLANGGIVIYNGPPGDCAEFIEKHAGIRMPDEDYNPASFLVEIASGEYGDEPIKALANQVKLEFAQNSGARAAIIKNSSFNLKPLNESIDNHEKGLRLSVSRDRFVESDDKNSQISSPNGARFKSNLYIDQRLVVGASINHGHYWSKFCILFKRCWISAIRDPKQLIARLVFSFTLPAILAWLVGTEAGRSNACPKYSPEYKLAELVEENSTSDNIQEQMLLTLENLSLLFVMIYALTCSSIGATTLTFTLDMQSSLKEYYNGWYQMPSYLIARFLTEVPMAIILPIVTISIGFPLTGQITRYDLTDAYRILITSGAVILASLVGQTLGMIVGAIYIDHVSTALFASQGATLPLVFLSGFVVRTKNMSKFVYALSYISYYKHALDATVVARYGFNSCGNCDPTTITGQGTKIVGVPERLKSFTQYWLSQFQYQNEESEGLNSNSSNEDDDIFQLFAKQVSLYNSNGAEIRTCNDIKPFPLYDLTLAESDVPSCYLALVVTLIVAMLLLFMTVKLVLRFRTSL